ncbi:hypothetical protein F0562_007871 [Nyssa sinensis]|uniref:Receptor-like serine/threonine-protein kinase n=1 Tax=Nyssa sinensis TaxID=561372 RepID=A0A5J5A701_9ASTE|nr:hypothetical protein F0562_007871 [Nyssa sinensis]
MASAILTLLFLSLWPFLLILAAENVTMSSSLTAGENLSWISPSEEFAFGFHQLGNSTNFFLLAIWYAKIPDETTVWHANTEYSVQRGSKVELIDDNIILNDPNGQTIWKALVEPNTSVSYGAMLNTGNFVLSAGTDSSYVWESFNNLTDTILPTQILSSGGMLFSRLTKNNYSKGRFELHFSNESLQLYPVAWPTEIPYDSYFTTMFNANSSKSGYQLGFSESASLYIERGNEEIVQILWQPSSPNSYYYRATLDFDGVFRKYAYPRSSIRAQSWSVVQYIPENICMALTHTQQGSGACGFNSYCQAESGTPRCLCPIGYSLMDPNNEYGGCKPNFTLGCGVDDESMDPEGLYKMERIPSLDWKNGDYASLGPYNQTQCEESCLHDCLCDVAIFHYTTCWKKKLPLSNGRLQNGNGALAFIKISKSVPPPRKPGSNTKRQKQILFGPLVVSKNSMKQHCGFNDELGRGSFGIVYKGALNFGSRNLVAVKKLDRLSQEGEREFRAEVEAIGKTHHKNLVELLGYCHEGPHRLLVYEFMSNGSLADFLFRSPRPDWNQRTWVALGIARGLVYLHEECNATIIHCDIKPQNILLDNHFTPRISDFGLAKSLMFDQTRTDTGIRGTRGYVAPEWFKRVPVTVKLDVYSFGVMLLEIICCRKSVEMVSGYEGKEILIDWVFDCYMEGNLEALMVENDDVGMCDIATLQRWVMIAIWCLEEDPSKRPTMKTVTQNLEGCVEVPIPLNTLSVKSYV